MEVLNIRAFIWLKLQSNSLTMVFLVQQKRILFFTFKFAKNYLFGLYIIANGLLICPLQAHLLGPFGAAKFTKKFHSVGQ